MMIGIFSGQSSISKGSSSSSFRANLSLSPQLDPHLGLRCKLHYCRKSSCTQPIYEGKRNLRTNGILLLENSSFILEKGFSETRSSAVKDG